ncbi:hypothetical protein BX600DRAFT_476287 [Xylariales sp. PMI_506]|nr:hypothetical protein BX600DRAFT_476287 [Xylariales sp. PMI_506]
MSECTNPPTVERSVSMVFTTVELLEAILIHLDIRCLLTSALRVCRQWRDLIQGSKQLQKALFFECEEKLADSHEITFNPLLVELFPLLFDFAGTPNPRGFNDLAIEALPIGRRRAAFYRLDASWRRMHMRQPPVKHVALWTLDKIRQRIEEMQMVQYDGGLRMEGLFFIVLKHVYWWDLFAKWGELQGRQLPHFKYVRTHMIDAAKEMVRTADVTIGALGDDYCVDEGNARRSGCTLVDSNGINEEKTQESVDDNGLTKMGIFWFKVKIIDDGKVMWERRDGSNY